MNERIDVLAVMHDAAIALANEDACGHAAELTDARAAVAELIEADKEYDAADKAWDNAPGCVQAIGDTDARDYDGPEYLRLVAAIELRAAALARVQGGAM